MDETENLIVSVSENTVACFLEVCARLMDYHADEFLLACHERSREEVSHGDFMRARGFELSAELADYLTSWSEMYSFRFDGRVYSFQDFVDMLYSRQQAGGHGHGFYLPAPADPFDALIQEWTHSDGWLDQEPE